jgi:glycosyltransferase involved in cell wall biosynthesis
MGMLLDDFKPDAIHIATEGTLGGAARSYCRVRRWPFTTSYHTQFADYLKKYFGVPKGWSYAYMRWFHNGAERVLVPTETLRQRLAKRGFEHLVVWTRGVDMQRFKPAVTRNTFDLPRPIFLYAGRVAIEKNIDAFLDTRLPGSKVVMGTGPALEKLRARFPGATFLGYQPPDAFAKYMAGADVMVFPSRTDTFGVVMLEALASGVPVAAYPVTGPLDVLDQGRCGVMHHDLREACLRALSLKPDDCRDHAARYSWQACADQAFAALAPI